MIAVSVIIPTYNRKDTIGRAIRSVLKQQKTSFEIIVVDDGSTDHTRDLILKEFPSVHCFAQPNTGPAAARNTGVRHSCGKWIAFLDSDDEWMDDKLMTQLDFFQENPGFRICQTEEIWIRRGKRVNAMKKHQKYGGWIFEKCLPLCIISPSAVMMERELLEECGRFDESLPACEDYDLWLRITAKYPVGLIQEPYIVKYGGDLNQRSRQFPAMDKFRIQSLVKILRSELLREDQTKAAIDILQKKSRIFVKGARKRNKEDSAQKMEKEVSEVLYHLEMKALNS